MRKDGDARIRSGHDGKGRAGPLALILLALALLATLPARAEEMPGAAMWSRFDPPAALPAVELDDLSGQPVALGDGPVVLHFWATWCTPCIAELPALDRLAGELAAKGVRVLAVSEDRGGSADIRPFLARMAPLSHLTVVVDRQRHTAAHLGLKMVPATLAIGADGRQHAQLAGAGDWDGADRRVLQDALGVGVSPPAPRPPEPPPAADGGRR